MSIDLTSQTLLDRLRRAREDRGLSQQEVADRLGKARTTVVAIERGQRALRADELLALAAIYGERLDALLRPDVPSPPLAAQFRYATKKLTPEQETDDATAELQRAAEDCLEIERLTGAPLVERYPPERGVPSRDLDRAAARLADEERRRLALGDGPLSELRETLESDVGIRTFSIVLPGRFGGMFAADVTLGACVAINASHPWEKQRWSLAHEYAHFLTRRDRPEITLSIEHYRRVPASERFADDFARHFLLPAEGLIRRWEERNSREKATVGGLLTEADRWGVSVQAFVLRVEQLKLVRPGWYDALTIQGLPISEARQHLGLPRRPSDTSALSSRSTLLAITAHLEGLLSEERLANVLRLDRLSTRKLVASVDGRLGSEGD